MQKHELAYTFEAEIAAKLRSLRVPRAKSVATDFVPKLMEAVPSAAFDPIDPWERGILHFHGDVDEKRVRKIQDEIAAAHINIKPTVPLTLYLSSFGGDWEAGLALCSSVQEVRRAGRLVNCHVQGTAMSMGSVLVQACDVRTIEPFATMMIHEIHETIEGKTSELRDRLAAHDRAAATLCGIYAQRSGRSADYWRERFARKDVFLTAREAVACGLVDRIKPVAKYPSKRITAPK